MLVIRLARVGRAKYPTYRIVAAESARTATGKFVAMLGHYNPHTKELVIKHEEVQKHLSNGAQPSNTVVKLLMREKVELPKWVKLKTKSPKVTETAATEAPAAEAQTATPEAQTATPETPDTEVTPAEAEADAIPALENADERVATVNEDAASAAEANAPSIDDTETAADQPAAK